MEKQIENLREKLNLLYVRNPLFGSDELLETRGLGLGKGNIRTWLSENINELPNMVPDRHLPTIAALYGIPLDCLAKPLGEFEELLTSQPFTACTWQHLAEQAVTTEAIQILSENKRGASHGLVEPATNQFRINDRVYIKAKLNELSEYGMILPPYYLLVLCSTAAGTVCLYPKPGQACQPLAAEEFFLPEDTPKTFFSCTGPIGLQRIHVLITSEPFEPHIYNSLHREENHDALDQISSQLFNNNLIEVDDEPALPDIPTARQTELGAELGRQALVLARARKRQFTGEAALFVKTYQLS